MSIPFITAEEAASYIKNGDNVGFSGFTASGTPKVVTVALAERAKQLHEQGEEFKINVFTGASTNDHVDGELARACDTLARYLQSAAPAPDAALRAAEKLVQPIKEFLARPASERADGMDEFCALLAERIGEMEAARTDLQPSRSENLQ